MISFVAAVEVFDSEADIAIDELREVIQDVVGVVHSKESATVNRVTYLKTTLKWQGATHEFKKLTPEIFQQLPSPGKYIRFELALAVKEERNETGQTGLLQLPWLLSVKLDELVTGSVPAKPPIPPAKV